MEIRNKENTTKNNIKTRQTNYDTLVLSENKIKNEKLTSGDISKNQTEIALQDSNQNIEKTNSKIEKLIKSVITSVNSEEKPIQKVQNSTNNNKNSASKEENIHKNHRQRLKNQFLENGISALTDIQKLELLLFFAIPQKDTNPIAHNLINKFGSIKNVFLADYNKLMEVNGVKENSALLIKLINSLYPAMNIPKDVQQITGVSEAKKFCTKLFTGVNVEQFYVICLTKNNQIKKYKMIQSGSADEIILQIRNITEFAISEKCNRIIVSHNHPEGKAIMSDEDFTFTYSLICSCLLNSIEVVDHIIVGTDTAISLAQKKVLQHLKETAFNALKISTEKQLLISSSSEEYKIDD